MADVTQEVWCPATSMIAPDATEVGLGSVQVRAPEETFVIIIERGIENHRTIFGVASEHLTNETGMPDEIDIARMHMAARAPTLYRLLEQVVQLGVAPRDLEEVIRINLHRAAPGVSPMPADRVVERKSAWQKLLGDDL
jgi:hypothetical protein